MNEQPNGENKPAGVLIITFDAHGNFSLSSEGAVPVGPAVNALEVIKTTYVQRQLAMIAQQMQQQAGKRLVLPDGSLAPPH